MAERKWTPAQRSAIEDEGGSLLVSAAAGSGKTAVLVERAVRLLARENAPVPADRLLIVTFTNAAAEELRTRIALRIEELIARHPDNQNLRRQRILLRRAAIGTIDAFCQQLVKEHFARLDIPPDVAVGEDSLRAQLSQQALDETMEEMYGQPHFVQLAALYGRASRDKAAEEAILNLYAFTRTLPQPRQQLQRFAAMYMQPLPVGQTPWGEELLGYARNAVQAAAHLLDEALAQAAAEPALAPYLPTLQGDVEALARLEEAVQAGAWDSCVQMTRGRMFAALKPVRGYEGGAKQRVQEQRARAKKMLERLGRYCFVCTQQEFWQDIETARPLVDALVQATLLYEEKYFAAKLEERALDFADFEHLALRLLQDDEGGRTPVAELVSRRYDVVMVDEYQDTNELQSTLYECLASPAGDNLFYVGDVKQSIYRFRKANPGIFLQKKRAWHPHNSGKHPAVIRLGHNFRSGTGVINGVNFVFGALMSEALGEVAYTQEECLLQGRAGGDEEGFELRLLDDEQQAGDAQYVAQRIAQMVQQGYPVRTETGTRPCGYGDFCILLRARTLAAEYVAALEAQGVSVIADAAEELLQTPEVLPVCAALAAIDNPGDEVNLAAALLGPLFGFSAEEVARIRMAAPKGSLWAALLACGQPKAQAFLQQMDFYRALAGEVPVARLCEELVARTGYLSAVAAMPGGLARRENLLRFLGWAKEATAGGRGGLSGFVRFLQNGKGPVPTHSAVLPGHVSVLTIHKSKGLEFPVCFLADTTRKFNTQDLGARVQLHAQLGIGLKLRNAATLYATLPALAIRQRTQREAMSEEMRVLYVALTRAKDKLVVTLAKKDVADFVAKQAAQLGRGAPGAFALMQQDSFAAWLLSALLRHPDAGHLLESLKLKLPAAPAQGRVVFGLQPAPAPLQNEWQEYRLTATPAPGLAQRITQSWQGELPRAALSQVPRKASVSALAKQQEPLRKRPSFMYGSGLTAAEKGSAQHAFMQYANYTAAAQNLDAEVQRLVAEGYIAAELAKVLDKSGLQAFFHSPLAARMAAARQLLREYDFMTAVPAGSLQPGLPPALAQEAVMVQGIADAVLVGENGVELVDYKTDHKVTPAQLVQRYTAQLQLYRKAVQKRLSLPVTKLTLWAFSLGREIDVPLCD